MTSNISDYETVLGKEQVDKLVASFQQIDTNGNGSLEATEIGALFELIGEPIEPARAQKIIMDIDANNDGVLDLKEFLEVYVKNKSGALTDSGSFRKLSKAAELVTHASAAGGQHSFSNAEVRAFSEYVNEHLGQDPLCKNFLPLIGQELFSKIRNGVLLIKLINLSTPDTIDERVMNKNPKNEFQMRENHDLALASAASIGCTVVNIGANDLLHGTPHLVLGLMWQIIRIGLVAKVNLQTCPGLACMLEDGETIKQLNALSPEELLIRWVNYHLKNAGRDKRIKNFTEDIKDSEAYIYLLHEIAPKDKKAAMAGAHSVMAHPNHLERAEQTLDSADKFDCRKFVTPQDVVEGNYKLNLAFVANLFNMYPGLEKEEEIPVEEEIVQETREEKTFRNWINSLGLGTPSGFKPVWNAPYVNSLYSGLADGLIILAIIDKIKPGIVQWNKICFPPYHPKKAEIQCRQNCGYAIEYAGQLSGVKLVAIGGNDIYDQNPTLVLGLIWQLMRAYTKNILDNLDKEGKHDKDVEQFIIQWVNANLSEKGKSSSIKDFKDKSIQNGQPIIDLIDCIRENIVDYSMVNFENKTEDSLFNNAKLAVNWGRKLGARIYALPEDIVEMKQKMVMTIFACLMERGLQNRD